MRKFLMKSELKSMFVFLAIILISGCSKQPNNTQINLKSVQAFRANSGANYIFVAKNTQE